MQVGSMGGLGKTVSVLRYTVKGRSTRGVHDWSFTQVGKNSRDAAWYSAILCAVALCSDSKVPKEVHEKWVGRGTVPVAFTRRRDELTASNFSCFLSSFLNISLAKLSSSSSNLYLLLCNTHIEFDRRIEA